MALCFVIFFFTVNLIGCLLIGLLWGLFCRVPNVSQNLVLFLSVGLCGGFTTFSTFMNESLFMLRGGQLITALAYMALSLVLGLACAWLGYNIVR